MSKIKCTIIQDLLPLYIDEVASEDTNIMVAEHIASCEECQREYELMKRDLYIPMETGTSVFKKIKRKWTYKKWLIAGSSVFLTIAIVFAAFYYVMQNDSIIAYDEDLMRVELSGQEVVVHYYGESYYSFSANGPIKVMVEGVERNILLLNLSETIAQSPSRDLFNTNGSDNLAGIVIHTIPLSENEKVDAIYYVPTELDKISTTSESFELLLEEATLIWEK